MTFAYLFRFLVLSCPNTATPQTPQVTKQQTTSDASHIRIILNDAVVSLTGIEGCPEQKDGLCPLHTFIKSQKKLIEGADWEWTCCGNWTIPEGNRWTTVTGDPPVKPAHAHADCASSESRVNQVNREEAGVRQVWGFE
jgi:hypothetical protein